MNALKQRAQAVLNDKSIDAQSRAIIRYAMEINDPWLAQLVGRVETGENIAHTFDFSTKPETNEDDPHYEDDPPHEHDPSDEDVSHDENDFRDDASYEKIEALAEIICGASDQSAAALLVLMRKFENSTRPQALAHTAKHFAFTRCSELNLYGMLDEEIAVIEDELLAGTT
jgi:hypothetical protein